MLLAQISDLHLDGSTRSTERAARTMAYLKALAQPVDAVLVTGDIAHHGTVAEYEEATRLFVAPFPVLTCPGNHDLRATYRTTLLKEAPIKPPRAATHGPINQVHHIAGTAILMCDSTTPGRDDGLLAPQTLDWIRTTLRELPPHTPALLALHHPPADIHHPLPDSCRLRNTDDLATLLDHFPQVVAVLAGHAHTAAASTFGGRPLLISPAVTWTLRLPWEGDEPADRAQPPALAFHVLDDSARLTTHFRSVL